MDRPINPLAGIKNGILLVQVPLDMPNAEIVAYGLLQSVSFMVKEYFVHKASEEAARLDLSKASIDSVIKNGGQHG